MRILFFFYLRLTFVFPRVLFWKISLSLYIFAHFMSNWSCPPVLCGLKSIFMSTVCHCQPWFPFSFFSGICFCFWIFYFASSFSDFFPCHGEFWFWSFPVKKILLSLAQTSCFLVFLAQTLTVVLLKFISCILQLGYFSLLITFVQIYDFFYLSQPQRKKKIDKIFFLFNRIVWVASGNCFGKKTQYVLKVQLNTHSCKKWSI